MRRELVADVVADLASGTDPALVAARFHASFAASTATAAARAADERGLETVVLSGGVFQNRLLLEQTAAAVRAHGLERAAPRAAASQRRRDRLRAGGRGRCAHHLGSPACFGAPGRLEPGGAWRGNGLVRLAFHATVP